MTSRQPLYVQKLTLKDIRCFEHLEIEFEEGESIVIIGDNGDGKSTVLRALAMGLCDQSSASALFRELHGDYVRNGSSDNEGTITVDLAGPQRSSDRFRIETTVRSLNAFERVEQVLFDLSSGTTTLMTQGDFPWERIFASGYGPGIRVQGTSDYEDYLTVDAVYPLFRYDVLLQNPELVVRRLMDAATRRDRKGGEKVLDAVKQLLSGILQLGKSDVLTLDRTGIRLRHLGRDVGLSALADGYRGTVTWILDLLAWWFVYRNGTTHRFRDVRGVVFIDEIEQHLHPRWQRNIVRLLTQSFPHVQFVATTHSPLVASGCEHVTAHSITKGEHRVHSPFGWLAEDVYRMMGLHTTRSQELVNRLEEYRLLDLKRLQKNASPAELARIRRIKQELRRLPAEDPVQILSELQNLRQALQDESPEERLLRSIFDETPSQYLQSNLEKVPWVSRVVRRLPADEQGEVLSKLRKLPQVLKTESKE